MDGWMTIAQWHTCANWAGPGMVFELANAEGQSMFSPCVRPVPAAPWDWTSPPDRFRPVSAMPQRHSEPLPLPVK